MLKHFIFRRNCRISFGLSYPLCTLTDADEDAMDQDSSDSCSDGLLSDSELVEEDDIPSTEKLCLSIPSEVSMGKEIM